jgi:predicted amino acid dehydrogenase
LQGVRLGGLRSAGRREALSAAASLAHELRQSADRQVTLSAGEPASAAAAARVDVACDQVDRLSHALSRLPHRSRIEADMVGAAGVLGEGLTRRLAPAALAETLVRCALRAALDLVRGRDEDRSLGR